MAKDKKWFSVKEINPPSGLQVSTCNLKQNEDLAPEITKLIAEKGITNPQIIEQLYYPSMDATYQVIEGKGYYFALFPSGKMEAVNVTHWTYKPKTPDNIAFNKNS